MDTTLPQEGTALLSETREREPKSYIPTYSLAYFGVMIALMTPVMVTMALKIKRIVPAGSEDGALGLVLGVGALFALFANPLVGRLSDRTTARWGMRAPWIVGGVLGGFLALASIGIAQNVATVLIGWCIAQASFNGALAAVAATLPDQVPVRRRGVVSGIVGLATPLAILAGSIMADQLTTDMTRFLVPGLFALVLGTFFALTLKDRKLTTPPTDKLTVGQFFGSFVFNPRKHPDFGWVWLTKFLVMFGYAGIATYLPYYLMDNFSMSEKDVTGFIVLYNVVGMAAMVISSPLGGILSDKIGKRRPFVSAAGVIMAIGLFLIVIAPSTTVLIIAGGIIGFGAGSFMSVDQALASETLPNKDDMAKDLGVLNIANALPQSIAPAIAPAIIAAGSATVLGGYQTWYLFGTLVALAGGILVYRIKGVK